MRKFETQVLIIGGGVTGTGVARDLALRGVDCLLVERADLNAGASGANHGLLHSGARYVSSDPDSAAECRAENERLRNLLPHCIEDTGGLFVAVAGDDERYIADFPELCRRAGIECEALDLKLTRELEPELSDRLIAAYAVRDATLDPFQLCLENVAQACGTGAVFLPNNRVAALDCRGNRVRSVGLVDSRSGLETSVEAELVVNATGAWAAEVAALAGITLEITYSKGTLMVTDHRVTGHVVNRLRPPSDGDIVVPGGAVSLIGTTSVRIDTLAEIRPTVREVDRIMDECTAIVPLLGRTRCIRAYAGVRPLMTAPCESDDRCVSRGFVLLDHGREGVENLVTIAGGKLTTYRLMAEKTADLVCGHLGVTRPGRTGSEPLPSTDSGRWTEPGLGPRHWLRQRVAGDPILCECEMLPRSVIETVIRELPEHEDPPDLRAIALRSRMGKGPCQGTFCGLRVTALLHDRGMARSAEGLKNLRAFLRQRWAGERAVLWGEQLVQAEFKEAIYCGLLGLEL